MKQGQNKIDAAVAKLGTLVNGWNISGPQGDSAHYNGDWLSRAAAAQAGIYGNSPEEATYPFTRKDSTGGALDGSKHKYTITFPAGQLPPVDAFWSVTMYDGKTQLLIKNPIDRYLINAPMLPSMKQERRRLIDAVHPEQVARSRSRVQLAARPCRPDLSGDAPLLAEGNPALHSAARQRHLAATWCEAYRIRLLTLNRARASRRASPSASVRRAANPARIGAKRP